MAEPETEIAFTDLPNWVFENLKIINMRGKLIPLDFNRAQIRVHNTLELQRKAGYPVRAIVLKARREGVCLAPDTKVLTSDLRWVEIDSLKDGDTLLAVDEFPKEGRGQIRQLRKSTVIIKREVFEPAYRITLEDGTVLTATGQHKFLTLHKRVKKYLPTPFWKKVSELKVDDCLRRVVKPWPGKTYEDGWMAGFIDGEGCLRCSGTQRGLTLSIAQKSGAVLDRGEKYLKESGCTYHRDRDDVADHLVVCNTEDVLHIIGQTRPTRFIDKLWWEGKQLPHKFNWTKVKSIESLPSQRMVDLQTSTKTYIANGYVSHNSTYVESRFFYWINMLENHFACIASADIDASDKVFRMSQLFQDKMPPDIKRHTKYSNRKEIAYAEPHRSQFLVQTAGKQVLGRGGLTHYLHCTEFAFWEDAKNQFGGAAQEVPDYPDTEIIIESTANGLGNAFYDMYKMSVDDWQNTKDLNNFLPIFLPWYIFPDYSKKLPEGFKKDEVEIELAKTFCLTDEQVYWRRWAIKNKCQGDDALFKQEYPSTWQEAFISTGNPVFSNKTIEWQSARIVKGARTAMFVGSTWDEITLDNVNRSKNCWQIKALPYKGGQYTIGIDTMEGRQSDSADERSQLDYHGVAIYDRLKNEIVAIYKGRGPQHELGLQCLMAARFYNDAWVAPEIPNAMVLLNLFKSEGYQNIYSRTVHEQHYVEKDSEDLGWRTTLVTRKWLVDDFISSICEAEPLRLNFADILEEMRWFIRDKTGKPIHSAGKHDDLLFSVMIALQAHKRCPIVQPIPSHTDTNVAKPKDKNINSLASVGVIDDDDEDMGDFENFFYTE